MFAAKFGEENVIREKAVEWPNTGLPLGELHTDLFIVPHQVSVEIKSSTSPGSILDSAIIQLAGEIHFDEESEAGWLMVVDPTGYEEDMLTEVHLTRELAEKIEDIAAQVAHAAKSGDLPDCSCANPGACQALGCPFTDQAWEGWEPPPFLPLDGKKIELVREFYERDRRRREHEAEAAVEKEAIKEIQQALLEEGCQVGAQYMVGPLRLKTWEIPGRETFSLSQARKTNVWLSEHDDLFGPFLKNGDGHVRWNVERVGDEPILTAVEDEDVPF
jgi:hypothetical protein